MPIYCALIVATELIHLTLYCEFCCVSHSKRFSELSDQISLTFSPIITFRITLGQYDVLLQSDFLLYKANPINIVTSNLSRSQIPLSINILYSRLNSSVMRYRKNVSNEIITKFKNNIYHLQ